MKRKYIDTYEQSSLSSKRTDAIQTSSDLKIDENKTQNNNNTLDESRDGKQEKSEGKELFSDSDEESTSKLESEESSSESSDESSEEQANEDYCDSCNEKPVGLYGLCKVCKCKVCDNGECNAMCYYGKKPHIVCWTCTVRCRYYDFHIDGEAGFIFCKRHASKKHDICPMCVKDLSIPKPKKRITKKQKKTK